MREPIPSSALLADIPKFTGFPESGEKFLAGLAKHNEKRWFDAHRDEYERGLLQPMRGFVLAVGERLAKTVPGVVADPRVGGSIFRMARDIRFSKDKSPYKTWCAARLWVGSVKELAPSFYVHVGHDGAYAGGGIYGFEDDQLARWRAALSDAKQRAALAAALKKAKGLEVGGQHYKRVPKGFAPDHPAAELLKHRGLYAGADLDAKRLRTTKAVDEAVAVYLRLAPTIAWLRRNISEGARVG